MTNGVHQQDVHRRSEGSELTAYDNHVALQSLPGTQMSSSTVYTLCKSLCAGTCLIAGFENDRYMDTLDSWYGVQCHLLPDEENDFFLQNY